MNSSLDRQFLVNNVIDRIEALERRLRMLEDGIVIEVHPDEDPGGLPVNLTEGPGIDVVGLRIGLGGDSILVFKSDGDPVGEYTTLAAAAAAAASGDTIVLPSQTITLTAGVTLPAGVALVGLGDKSIISASGFSGAAITMAADAVCRSFALTFVSNGTTALGIDARFARAKIVDVTVNVSGGSATNIAVELGVNLDGPGTLSHYGTSPGVTTPDSKRYMTSGMTNPPYWHGAGYRIQSALSLGTGQLRVTVYCEVGTTGDNYWSLMQSDDSANTGISPDTTPSLTGATSNTVGTMSAGNSYVLTGTGSRTWHSDGYFAIKHGYWHNGLTVRVTKVEWGDGSPTTWHTLWEEGASIADAPQVVLCKLTATGTGADALVCDASTGGFSLYNVLNGAVYDVNATGTLYLYGSQYDQAEVSGTPIPLAGDRSAYSIEDWHASDIEAGALTRHNPLGSAIGDILCWDGSKWVLLADILAGSYLRSGGVASLPAWSTLKLPNSAAIGDILYATDANSVGNLVDVAVGSVLVSGGIGVVPTYSTSPSVTGTITAKPVGTAGIQLDPNAATGNFTLSLSPANLTGSRRIIFPDYSMTWPAADAVGFLHSDGAGNLTWAAGGGGDISGTGIVGQIAEFVTDTKTLQAATLIKTGAHILTIATGAVADLTWTIPANAAGYFKNDGSGGMSWEAAVTPAAHVLNSASHTVSGRAAGQVLIATGATSFDFSGFLLSGTAGGTTSLAVTTGKTLTFTATDSFTATIESTGTVAMLGIENVWTAAQYISAANSRLYLSHTTANNASGVYFREGVTNEFIIGTGIYTANVTDFDIGNAATSLVRISTVGNVKIAGVALRATTEGTNHLDIFDGTAPVGTLANGISLYSTSGVPMMMNAAGAGSAIAGVAYANTFTASQTINAGYALTVDTSTLVVDAGNHRVGIVKATPLAALHVGGIIRLDNDQPLAGSGAVSGSYGIAKVNASNFVAIGDGVLIVDPASATEKVRITSTGVGIGMTPVRTLDVTGTFRTTGAITIPSTSYFIGNAANGYRFNNAADSINCMIISDVGAVTLASSITTGAPTTGTAGAWKLGIRVAANVTINANEYIQLDIGGTLYWIPTCRAQ